MLGEWEEGEDIHQTQPGSEWWYLSEIFHRFGRILSRTLSRVLNNSNSKSQKKKNYLKSNSSSSYSSTLVSKFKQLSLQQHDCTVCNTFVSLITVFSRINRSKIVQSLKHFLDFNLQISKCLQTKTLPWRRIFRTHFLENIHFEYLLKKTLKAATLELTIEVQPFDIFTWL